MNSHELAAYLAGFFDGEGTVSINKRKPRIGYETSWSFQLQLHLCQQDPAPLELLKLHFGGNLYKCDHIYRIYLGSQYALRFLLAIAPYAVVKKDQIELGIAFQVIRSQRSRGRVLSESEVTLFDGMRSKMMELNHSKSRAFHEKPGELLETPTLDDEEDNQQPSSLNGEIVGEKVHRLMGEEPTNNPNTSARPEREDIVGAA